MAANQKTIFVAEEIQRVRQVIFATTVAKFYAGKDG